MFALGIIEGYLTCDGIDNYYPNAIHALFEGMGPSPQLQVFLDDNLNHMRNMTTTATHGGGGDDDDYWYAVGGVLSQLEGMVEGYHKSPCITSSSSSLSFKDFLLLQAYGDMFDLSNIFAPSPLLVDDDGGVVVVGGVRRGRGRWRGGAGRNNSSTNSINGGGVSSSVAVGQDDGDDGGGGEGKEGVGGDRAISDNNPTAPSSSSSLRHHQHHNRHHHRCTGVVKLLSDHTNVLFGHTTWDLYSVLYPRIFKHVIVPVIKSSTVITHKSSFSSSPGNTHIER